MEICFKVMEILLELMIILLSLFLPKDYILLPFFIIKLNCYLKGIATVNDIKCVLYHVYIVDLIIHSN